MDIIKGDCYEAGLWSMRNAEAMVRDGNVVNPAGIPQGKQIGWLNVRSGSYFRIDELADTGRNNELLDYGEIIRVCKFDTLPLAEDKQ